MTFYKNTKATVYSSDGDTVFFDIVTGDLQWKAQIKFNESQ